MAGLYESDLVVKMPGYFKGVFDAVNQRADFLGVIRHVPAQKNKLAEWTVRIPNRRGDPTGKEGADKTSGFGKRTPRKLSCYGQRVESEGWMVTDLAELTDTNDVKGARQAADQQAQDGTEGLLAVQDMLLTAQDTANGADATDDMDRTRGVFSWLASDAQTVLPVHADVRPTSAMRYASTLALFTEAAFKTMLQAASEQIDRDVDLVGYVGSALADQMALWSILVPTTTNIANASQVVSKVSDMSIERKVTFFRFMGMQAKNVVQRRMLCDLSAANAKTAYTTRSGAWINPEMWELDWMEAWHHVPLLDQGGGPRGFHRGWCRLRCKCPMGQVSAYIGS